MYNIGKADPFYPGRKQSDNIAVIKFVANAEQHFNIPTGATVAVFSSQVDFYALTNGQTVAVPIASATTFPTTTIPELNPVVLSVVAGNLLSVISASAGICTISFYRDHDP